MNRARLTSDQKMLRGLATRAPHLIEVEREVGNPPREYLLRLHCRGVERVTAGGAVYRDVHSVRIRMAADYPFSEPLVEFVTPILHPHIWAHDNHVCLGTQWRPTEFLDLLVCRMFKVIQMDPAFINPRSLANHVAYTWVRSNVRHLPLGTADPCTAPTPKGPSIRFTRT